MSSSISAADHDNSTSRSDREAAVVPGSDLQVEDTAGLSEREKMLRGAYPFIGNPNS